MSAVDFASHLLNWRLRHGLDEKQAAAILAVSTTAIILWQKPGFEPPVKDQAMLLERMAKFKPRK